MYVNIILEEKNIIVAVFQCCCLTLNGYHYVPNVNFEIKNIHVAIHKIKYNFNTIRQPKLAIEPQILKTEK